MTPETKLKNKVMKYLKANYPGAWIVKLSDRYTSGLPDIIMLHDGMFYAFELKCGRNKLSKIQEYNLELIRKNKGYALSNTKFILEMKGGETK